MVFENYKKFGKCAVLSKGGKKMLVTVDVGPRIIFYGYEGGENIFFEDSQDSINRDSDFIRENLKGKGIWHIYGGHRLWKSPEYEDTYYPDNAPVEVVERGNVVDFISEAESTTGLKKVMSVEMHEDGNATVTHSMQNVSDKNTPPVAIWTLSVMDKGAEAVIPLSEEDTGLLPNRNLVLWSYTDIKDERFTLTDSELRVKQNVEIKKAFKLGTFIQKAVAVNIKGMQFKLDFDVKEGDFADYSCNLECYTCDKMLEIETLSPLTTIKPGQILTHVVRLSLEKQS